MSRLSKLYQAMETLREEGLKDEDLEQKVSVLEENIIKKEILPIVTKNIGPALEQVKRDLVLVVDYHPGSPVRVSLSRKTNINKLIDDAKLLEIDPEVEHSTNKNHKKKVVVNPKLNIRVSLDGQVFENRVAKNTLVEVIEKIGVERVRSLGLTWCKVPVISTTKDKKYPQTQSGRFYIITHSSTGGKKRLLEKIAEKLGMDMQIDLIDIDGSVIPPHEKRRKKNKK